MSTGILSVYAVYIPKDTNDVSWSETELRARGVRAVHADPPAATGLLPGGVHLGAQPDGGAAGGARLLLLHRREPRRAGSRPRQFASLYQTSASRMSPRFGLKYSSAYSTRVRNEICRNSGCESSLLSRNTNRTLKELLPTSSILIRLFSESTPKQIIRYPL